MIYDGVKWTWNMPEGKRDRLLVLLGKGIREGELSNEEVQVMAGKINHYASIVRGKFERSLIIHTVKEDKGKMERIVVGKQARIQMTWWLRNMNEVEDEWPGAWDVFHTGRRTSLGERVADALSKGNMREVEDEWPGAVDMSMKGSVVLDRWIQDSEWTETWLGGC